MYQVESVHAQVSALQATQENLLVSVIIPTLNEAQNIRVCLESLEHNKMDGYSMEVIVVDAGSTDGTSKIVEEMSQTYHNIILVKSNIANVAFQRNVGVQHSNGRIILNFSGHAIAPENLIGTLATRLLSSELEVGGVGCAERKIPEDNSIHSLAINSVTRNIFGGGLIRPYNLAESERFVNSVAFCAYRREILFKVGLFDASNPFGDDADLNLRIRKAGYKILFTPSTFVYYEARATLRKFFVQMYRYGRSRMWIMRKQKTGAGAIYFVSLLPIFYVILLTLDLLFNLGLSLVLFITGLIYLSLVVLSSGVIAVRQKKIALVGEFTLVFVLEHTAYGFGMVAGLLPRGRQKPIT